MLIQILDSLDPFFYFKKPNINKTKLHHSSSLLTIPDDEARSVTIDDDVEQEAKVIKRFQDILEQLNNESNIGNTDSSLSCNTRVRDLKDSRFKSIIKNILENSREEGSDQFDFTYSIELIFNLLSTNINQIHLDHDENQENILLIILKYISILLSSEIQQYLELFINMGFKRLLSIITQKQDLLEQSKIGLKIKSQVLKIQTYMTTLQKKDLQYRFRTVYFNNYNFKFKTRQLQYNSVGLGYKLWDSSLLLSEIILRNSSLFVDQSILEIGSGCGLSGSIAAAQGCKSFLLTDFVDAVNLNIQFNLDLNFKNIPNLNNPITDNNLNTTPPNHLVYGKVDKLDWNNLQDYKQNELFDIVFGSDLVYSLEAAETVPKVISKFLKPNGLSIIVLPKVREGISLFESNLPRYDLKILNRKIVLNSGDDGDLLVYILNKII
ncbi:hypothetical protein CYY_009220 [Polysphondylium violaceum]|uniref:Uncharacterized protein n=1 Tax=Polysphondylium violaceum TaxID=133409 RepID=A0A8J4UW93_9MYCE|nr:hypothetical protein CYY_009220 [Polysphondylium violaceum]